VVATLPDANDRRSGSGVVDIDPDRLRRMIDAVPDGISVQAADGRIVLANAAAAHACGFDSVDAFVAATHDEIVARFELWDEERRPIELADMPGARVLTGEPASRRIVGYRIRSTGEERWAEVSAAPVAADEGRIEFAITSFHDVTDRRQALEDRDHDRSRLATILAERLADETRLAELIAAERARLAELTAIIAAIGEGIVVADVNGQITMANRAAREMLEPFEETRITQLLDRFAWTRTPTLDDVIEGGPHPVRLSPASTRWLEVAAYPVRETSEVEAGGTILVIRDVTEARERDQARDAFIGMLSHELRTPVTTIYAGAKLLSRGGLEDATRESIFEDIHGEAERLHRLVEDVVALTRVGEGALDIGDEPVLLQRVLPAVVRSEQSRWPGGRFELALQPDLPPVSGDPTYVEQVVRNLLANAMKYGGESSQARIEAAEGGGEVIVRVLDEGPGFPAIEAERLFELYYRSPTAARKVSGSGIGLFVCARLIDAMGGRIWAANRPAGGAEFGFALNVMAEER
jgi:PAS domain S-box-containing protein